ncbi:MAG: DUF2344 domain-containing protein [Lachnospiraceae bacterium]|nr:DUF2344 domain-containing protein [Lachnospiraceae bacterium]
MKLRVKFSKYGALRFIGHLDVMRFFQKAIRRAGIDIAYSSGFSPHQIMSFAQPLGIGLESNGEYMDIEVNSITTEADMMQQLNAQMVEGIEVLEIKLLPETAGNAMASVSAATYTIRFREGYEPGYDYVSKLADFYAQDEIVVTKQTKRSESTFDMKPSIYDCHMLENGKDISITVDCSSAGNIKPSLVMKAFYEQNDVELNELALLVTREETYTNLGNEENRKLVPLGQVGDDF